MQTLAMTTVLSDASPIAFGCMGLGGQWDGLGYTAAELKQAHHCIEVALEEGINFFDHADIYCNGKSEQIFGEILATQPQLREQIYIQSKCGIRFADQEGPQRYDFSYQHIIDSVNGSLRRLGCGYLDILLLHRPDPLMEPEEVARAFEQLAAAGKVRHFGVSNMNHHQLQFLQRYLDQPLVVNQMELNLLHCDFVESMVTVNDHQGQSVHFSEGLIEYCAEQNVQLQAWSPLAKGVFGRPATEAKVAMAQEHIDQYARQFGCERETILLAWLMRLPIGIQPVIGTMNEQRIRACAKAVDVSLSREQWYQLFTDIRGHHIP
ncbi:aldo/keto reductase family oxidoreductase [Celerinatantimonas sp. YJH-8]|uniref:aldo/keto reductase n=1 Tax=Celerinatantimonas sp. YJH-8 TaxID=3228714 RepID=UPI0038C7CAA0